MTIDDPAAAFIETFERLDVPYLIVGSYSSNHYSIARATDDADFVVELEFATIEQIARELTPRFRHDPQIAFETITGAVRHIFYEVSTGFRVDVFELSDDPFAQSRFERRCLLDWEGRQIWGPTPEDVIVIKARWALRGARVKDEEDIHNVLVVQGVHNLDWKYIYHWADEHGTRELIDRIRVSVPEA